MTSMIRIKTTTLLWLLISIPLFAANVGIDLSSEKQKITGFGGMNFPRWIADLTEAQADKAFGVGDGKIGLSVLRISVAPVESDWSKEVTTAKRAVSYGASVFGTPWSPPASMKTNGNIVKGELKTSSYADYATYLSKFVNYMSTNGVDLYGISIQNEPDWLPDYESCGWSATQIYNFIKNNAGVIPTKVIAAEGLGFNKALTDPVLNDATAAANIDIVAGHLYGTTPSDYPLARNKGKEIWMTEHYTTSDISANLWPEALEVGKEIHNGMVSYYNAYIWWYIRRSYGLITEDGNVSKRGYVMSHFSRFVRPGYVRVDVNATPATNVLASAYTKDGNLVVVLTNSNSSTSNLTFDIKNATTSVTSFKKYTTSSSKNVSDDGSVAVTNGTFSVSLDASSITTLVFTAPLGTPTVAITAPVSNASYEAPATVEIAATATDPDGTISKVEFYNGTTKLGEDATSPYTYSWTNVAEGSYSITAVATDNEGKTATSSAVTIQVHIPQAPYSGTSWTIPGTIEAENFDVGGEGVAYQDNETENRGGAYRTDEGVDIEGDATNGYMVGYTITGEWLEYTVNVENAGTYIWKANVASGGSTGAFHLLIDDVAITDTVSVPNTGSYTTYTTVTDTTPALTAGNHVMRLVVDGDYFNMDWITFSNGTVSIKPELADKWLHNSGTYQVYNPLGVFLGSVNLAAGESIEKQVGRLTSQSGTFLVKAKNSSKSYLIHVRK